MQKAKCTKCGKHNKINNIISAFKVREKLRVVCRCSCGGVCGAVEGNAEDFGGLVDDFFADRTFRHLQDGLFIADFNTPMTDVAYQRACEMYEQTIDELFAKDILTLREASILLAVPVSVLANEWGEGPVDRRALLVWYSQSNMYRNLVNGLRLDDHA